MTLGIASIFQEYTLNDNATILDLIKGIVRILINEGWRNYK